MRMGCERGRRGALLPFLLIVAAACGAPSTTPRSPAPNALLSVGPDVYVDEGPFRVVFSGPKGDVENAHEITVAFSRPIRGIGTLEDGIEAAKVTRVHDGLNIPGKWRWLAERTAVFWPKGDGLANATEYEVTINASLRSFDDATLEPFAPFRFASRRPKIDRAQHSWEEDKDLHTITIELNQMASHESVRSGIRIEGKGPKGIVVVPYTIGKSVSQQQFELAVDRSIVSLEDVEVVVAPTLASMEGPLTAGIEQRVSLPEFGPQKVELVCTEPGANEEKTNAKRCSLESGSIALRFSKTVRGKDLARHLVFDDPKPKSEADPLADDWVNDLDLDRIVALAPGKKYKVTVKAGLPSTDKDRLAADHTFTFETADYQPSLRLRDIDADGVVESARPEIVLSLSAMNVPSFEAVRAPLDEQQLFSLLGAEERKAGVVRALPKAITTKVETKGKRNEGTSTSFDLPSSLRPAGTSGIFAVATSAPGIADDVRILSVTDLGITTKWSPHGGLVWVTHLSDGRPVKDAKVRLLRRGKDAAALATNADGIATIPAQLAATFLDPSSDPTMLVSAGEDVAFARLPELDAHLTRSIGLVFTERRLYRPGEVAFVKGLFRAPSAQGLVSLPGRRVRIEAFDDDQRALFETTTELDAFGAFSCEMPIPRNARLGFAHLRASIVSRPLAPKPRARSGRILIRDWNAQTRFTIDEYRTVEMKLETSVDEKEHVAGARAEISVSGKYLFGAPMHDMPVIVQASRQAGWFQPKGLEEFSTDSAGLWSTKYETFMPATKVMLDANGVGHISVPLALPNQLGPETVNVDASITDVSDAFMVGDRSSFLVHPAEIYVGVRRADPATRPWIGRPIRAEVAVAGLDGTRRANVPVRLELLHRKDPKSEPTSTGRTCNVISTEKAAGCELAVTEPGTYWVTARANDAQGRPTAAAISFDVQKEEPPKPKPEPRPAAPVKPELPLLTFDEACKSDKLRTSHGGTIWIEKEEKEYAAGDRVHACLRGRGLALFTQEREGVLSHEVRSLAGPGETRDVPIVPLHHPNVHLALHSVSGRTAPFPAKQARWSSGRGHPTYESGSREVRVARPKEKSLQVSIDTGEEHRPGEQLEATVRVLDGNGRPTVAQVTFWAVDQGVLELEPFKPPEPAMAFGDTRRSDVLTVDSRAQLLWEKIGIHRTKAPSLRMGATSASPPSHVGRSIFRPTAWFLPTLVTGPDGTVKARLKLPDNVTTWKVFAVAATATEAFGNAEASFVTKKPLIARPALPRFLRAGDRFEAMAVIDSMEKRPLEVKVQMHARGALAGDGALTVPVPPEGHVPVRFPVTAPARGTGRISFRADASGGLSDDVTIEEDVTTPTTLETIVLGGETRAARVDEPLGDLSRARADVGGLDYRLSSTPLIGMAESIQGLIEYPYGCTEQLSSRLVPLVRLRSMARDLGVALPSDVDGAVRNAIASVLSHQRSDGGFGFWQESAKSEPWLTVIALSALQQSKEAGFTVPDDTIERAVAWVEHAEGLDNASRAMLEDLFASLGRPRDRELRVLATDADKLPLFARALLAHALAKVDRALAQRVLDGVAAQAKLTATTATIADEPTLPRRLHLSSDTRTTAMALRAFVAVDPKSPLTAKLARGLLALRRKGRWPTTQESAWAIVALDDARALYPPPPSTSPATFRVMLDGANVAHTRGAAASTGTIPMAKLVAATGGLLSFTAEGAPLFYQGTLRYARKEPPATPLEHGLHVARTLKTSNPSRPMRVGENVEVEVVVMSPVARELVVVDDPIPAGFEAVNEGFANRDRTMRTETSLEVTHREMRDDRVVTFFDRLRAGTTRTTYRLRVIAAGRFAHPPAKVECMYAPDVFGRTAAATVETR